MSILVENNTEIKPKILKLIKCFGINENGIGIDFYFKYFVVL